MSPNPNRDNFILGYGERLTESIAPPPSMMTKNAPYTFNEAVRRLTPKLSTTARKLSELPAAACPAGQTVAAITLHPTYTAKSYHPTALFQELGVEPIGSKQDFVTPEKWTRQGQPERTRTTTIFVKGQRDTFNNLPAKISEIASDSTAGLDLVKVENIEPISEIERVKDITSDARTLELEVVLHTGTQAQTNPILRGFNEYLSELGIDVDLDKRLQTDGLCFLGLMAPRDKLDEIAKYSFLRAVREMPHIRSLVRSNSGLNYEIALPDGQPIDPGMLVAVFDGGVPANTLLEPWVRSHDVPGIGEPVAQHLQHGVGVTGALLFGPLQSGIIPDKPYCFVDHYRVLDDKDDEITVLTRIRGILESTNYGYVNISIGPPEPIDYNDVNPWTAVLDEIIFQKNILATIATGNDGDKDEAGGNTLIQPPSDAVNGLAMGAANKTGEGWTRAPYSSYGPGRAPGIIKPDVVCFGGSDDEPYYLVDTSGNHTRQDWGTSYAAPTGLRTALGIRAHFGEVLSPIALKALLVHSAEDGGHEKRHCGWGRVPLDFRGIVATDGSSMRVVYQGTLSPAEWMNVPIPVPAGVLEGMVTIKATLCYFTAVDSKNPNNYTRAGMEVRFRPHSEKRTREARTGEHQEYPDSKPFFQIADVDVFEDDLSHNAHFWETTLCASKTMRGAGLNEPTFNLHYNARSGGARAESDAPEVKYALVVTVTAKRHANLYDQVVNRYRTQLQPLQPVVQIPIVTTVT